jgi:hypothetical protein
MGASPTDPVGSLLCLVMLVPSVSASLLRSTEGCVHVLACMAVGLAAGVATGALFGNGELGGKLAW